MGCSLFASRSRSGILFCFIAGVAVHVQTNSARATPRQVSPAPAVRVSLTTAGGAETAALVAPEPDRGETSVNLAIGNGIRSVPASRVTVPVGETLRINAPVPVGQPVQWFKNGKALPGTTLAQLTIPFVMSSDAGTYSATAIDPVALVFPSQSLVLGVGPTDRLLNLSARGMVAAGAGQSFIAGFAVAGGGTGKKMVVRAIGPSLGLFGVAAPLAKPVLRIFDGNGRPYNNGYVYPPVVDGPTYESDLADSLSRVGAFPTLPGSADVVLLMPFVAGNYTAQVTSADNAGGNVMIEIYEVP